MLLQRIRELAGLRWELWDAEDRGRRTGSDLRRARAERMRLEQRLGAARPAPTPTATNAEPEAARVSDVGDLAVVVLCPDFGRDLDRGLTALRRIGVREPTVAAARCGLFTEQRLLQLEREGVRVHRSARSIGRAANDAVRAARSSYALVLRAGARLAAGALERARVLAADAGNGVAVLTAGPACASPRAGVLLAGLAPGATLVERALFDELGGFDEAIESGLDLELWLRAAARAARVTILEAALEPGDSFFAGQAWDEELERIVAPHAAALADEETLSELGVLAAEMQRRVAEARDLTDSAEQELRGEREALASLRARLREAGRARLDLGDLPRDGLVSEEWGAERGTPIDRHYIEIFLRSHEQELRGRCLEIKEAAYAKWLGGARVTACDVLDIDTSNQGAIHGDLAQGAGIPDAQYDCFVLTQTLHLVYDFKGALFHAVRVLEPGGSLLVTVPAISRIMPGEGGIDTDYWRFTEASMRRLFAELLPLDAFEVTTYGNATAAAAFLYGLAAEDLEPGELERADPHFPVIVAVQARKPA